VTWYPGWDSLDSVRNWHTIFEISGIAFLALLVGAEILAFQYGHRKDELVAVAEHAAETRREQSEATTKAQRDAETAQLQRKLAEAQKAAEEAGKKAASVEQAAAARHLTESQRSAISNAIAPFSGKAIDIVIPMGDNEAKSFAAEFVAVFRKAGWDAGQNDGINQAVWTGPPTIGVQVTLNQNEASANRLPPGAEPLIRALIAVGLTEGGYVNPGTAPGKIELRVGSKPMK
jgi:hypothetical protein